MKLPVSATSMSNTSSQPAGVISTMGSGVIAQVANGTKQDVFCLAVSDHEVAPVAEQSSDPAGGWVVVDTQPSPVLWLVIDFRGELPTDTAPPALCGEPGVMLRSVEAITVSQLPLAMGLGIDRRRSVPACPSDLVIVV